MNELQEIEPYIEHWSRSHEILGNIAAVDDVMILLLLTVVWTTLLTPTPGAEPSRIGNDADAAVATIFAGGGMAMASGTAALADSAPIAAGLLGAGAPCRRTSTDTLSARRSHATPSLSAASVNS